MPQAFSPFQRGWLILLLLFWAVLLFGGFALGTPDAGPTQRIPTWARLGSSLVLVVAGWSWYGITREEPARPFTGAIALGMTLGFLGDALLALPNQLSQILQAGMAAFALGHIAYIAAIWKFGNESGLPVRWEVWSVWLVIGLVGWSMVVYPSSANSGLVWTALPYTLLLASTTGFATSLAFQAWLFAPLAVGATLFFLSDMILAAQMFRQSDFPLINSVVWLMYGPGQMLIVYSGAAARAVTRKEAPVTPGVRRS